MNELKDFPFIATIVSGPRVTIPEELAKLFDLKQGDTIKVQIELVNRLKSNNGKKVRKKTAVIRR